MKNKIQQKEYDRYGPSDGGAPTEPWPHPYGPKPITIPTDLRNEITALAVQAGFATTEKVWNTTQQAAVVMAEWMLSVGFFAPYESHTSLRERKTKKYVTELICECFTSLAYSRAMTKHSISKDTVMTRRYVQMLTNALKITGK